ncbi:type VI secretion system-associated protein TagF [uncultured Sphingomonas sp.]|uniref:type VI secretion system-associated protein TagF n=1 Tax=uncultured Sphingomonas sp. TaxID=158754 RepID=UPI003748BB7D
MTARLFGKLPAHGDFVARGCSSEERAALDAWLTESMEQAQRHFGPAFAERFDMAQPWIGEGLGVSGIIAASQDAAGRRYPLILLAALRDGLDDLAYAAIAERWDADRVVEALGPRASGSVTRWSSLDGREARDDAFPLDIVTAMLSDTVA